MIRKEKDKDEPNFIERFVLRLVIKKAIKKIENMKGSWKTTILGWLTLILAIGSGIGNLLDGNPATVVNFQAILDAFAAVGILIPAGIGLLFARDKDVSTEEQRAAHRK